jgi:hypothetical protein
VDGIDVCECVLWSAYRLYASPVCLEETSLADVDQEALHAGLVTSRWCAPLPLQCRLHQCDRGYDRSRGDQSSFAET